MTPILELFKLSKAYPTPTGSSVIVKEFNLNLDPGEFVTVIGHSGCGKSTVLSMIAGLTDATGGAMILGGRFLVPGAQEAETYVTVLRKAVARG